MATHTSEVIMKFVDQFSSGFDKSIKRIQSGTLISKRTINDLNRAGDTMLRTGTMMFVPLAAGIKACVDAEMQYENAVAKVRTIADTSEKSIKELGDEMTTISKTYGQGIGDVADTFYNVISATVDTKNAIDYVRVASDMAVGGFADMNTAVGGLTASMASYQKMGYDMYRIGDLLAQTQVYGKTTINELASSLGTVLPFASNVGMAFEDLSTAMAVLTSNGLDTEMATTAFKNAISSILSPSASATKAFEKMGVAYGSQAFSKMDFTTYLENLREAVGLSEDAKKKLDELMADENTSDEDLTKFFENAGVNIDNLLTLFGNIRGATAMLSLVGSVEKFKNFREKMNEENSTGTLKKQAEIMMESPQMRMNILKENFTESLRRFGEKLMPKVNQLMESATGALDKLNAMSDEQISQIVDNVLKIAAASAGLIVLGTIAKALASILTLGNMIWKPLSKLVLGGATKQAAGQVVAGTAGKGIAGTAGAVLGKVVPAAIGFKIGMDMSETKIADDSLFGNGPIVYSDDPDVMIAQMKDGPLKDRMLREREEEKKKLENNTTNNTNNESTVNNETNNNTNNSTVNNSTKNSNVSNNQTTNNNTTNITISNVNVDGVENLDGIIKELENAADSMR